MKYFEQIKGKYEFYFKRYPENLYTYLLPLKRDYGWIIYILIFFIFIELASIPSLKIETVKLFIDFFFQAYIFLTGLLAAVGIFKIQTIDNTAEKIFDRFLASPRLSTQKFYDWEEVVSHFSDSTHGPERLNTEKNIDITHYHGRMHMLWREKSRLQSSIISLSFFSFIGIIICLGGLFLNTLGQNNNLELLRKFLLITNIITFMLSVLFGWRIIVQTFKYIPFNKI